MGNPFNLQFCDRLECRQILFPRTGLIEEHRQTRAEEPADRPAEPDTVLVAYHIEQCNGQHHTDNQVGERRYHERTHCTGTAQHAVAHELGAYDQIERYDRESDSLVRHQ